MSVTLWTDWAIPTLTFNLYLTGFDVERLDLREVLAGAVPVTGAEVSPVGALSDPGSPFPGCAGSLGPGSSAGRCRCSIPVSPRRCRPAPCSSISRPPA